MKKTQGILARISGYDCRLKIERFNQPRLLSKVLKLHKQAMQQRALQLQNSKQKPRVLEPRFLFEIIGRIEARSLPFVNSRGR